MSDKSEEDLYTIQQVAEHLKVHYQTVRNLIQQNQIMTIKIGRNIRIPASELEKFSPKKKQKERYANWALNLLITAI